MVEFRVVGSDAHSATFTGEKRPRVQTCFKTKTSTVACWRWVALHMRVLCIKGEGNIIHPLTVFGYYGGEKLVFSMCR